MERIYEKKIEQGRIVALEQIEVIRAVARVLFHA
jgi:hypothetical protein